MQKYKIVPDGKQIENEICRLSNKIAELFNPNDGCREGERGWLTPHGNAWEMYIAMQIYSYLVDLGVDPNIAEAVADEAVELYPWKNADIVIYNDFSKWEGSL
jgi:hypothetical protein